MDNLQGAQTNQLPSNAASRAEDFQPLTQNPQTAPSSLQPTGSDLQNVSTGQFLTDNPRAQILVPGAVGQPQTKPATTKAEGGLNWTLFIIAFLVLAVFGAIWRQARQPKPQPVDEPAMVPKAKTKKKKRKKSRGRSNRS